MQATSASQATDPAHVGATGPATPWYEGFKDEAVRTSPVIQKFSDPEALAGAYVNLEKRFGIDPNRRVDLPADPKDEAGWQAVWAKLGRPDKPDGYGFQLGEGATDADKQLVTDYAATAHKLGLNADQARGAMQFLIDQQAKSADASKMAFEARAREGRAELHKEWGQAYETRVKDIAGAVRQYGDEALAKELDETGIGNYPNLAKMISRMMERMAEPGSLPGRSGEAAPINRGPLTPAQAQARLRELETNPALRDRNHPQHKALVEERLEVSRQAFGVAA